MSYHQFDFGESTFARMQREGDVTHVELKAGDESVRLSLHDGNSGPSLLIDLQAFITHQLIDLGYRNEVDTNVHSAMARKFRQEATG